MESTFRPLIQLDVGRYAQAITLRKARVIACSVVARPQSPALS